MQRRDEQLSPDQPLVLLTAQGRRLLVTAVSAGAEAAGVKVGMTAAQAEVACPDALFREEAPTRHAERHTQLLERLQGLTPMVEPTRLGLFYLGMRGLRWLFRDEAALLQSTLQDAAALGLEATAGAAGSRFTSLMAAKVALPGAYRQVALNQDMDFLSPLPLSYLPASAELLERLRLVGVETMGALASLSPRAVERRYGAEGVHLYRLARAEDDATLTPHRPPPLYSRRLLLEEPVEQAEGLLFLLNPLLESLLEQLRQEGRACAGLELHLTLERKATLQLPVPLGSPVTVTRPLLDLLRLKLARLELPSRVLELELQASRVTEPSTPQGDLFQRVGSPTGMAMTIARLVETLGAEAVVLSAPADGWRLDQAFTTTSARDAAPGLLEAAENRAGSQRMRGARAALKEERRTQTARKRNPRPHTASPPAAAPETGSAGQGPGNPTPLTPAGQGPAPALPADVLAERGNLELGFRRLEPPRPVQLQCDEEGPVALTAQARRRQVLRRQGPFRYEGQWWTHSYARDYYILLLGDGTEVLVYREQGTERTSTSPEKLRPTSSDGWFLEGVYD